MGAETFSQIATGKTAKEAFQSAQESARYDFGHSGYTGTIAEKSDFIMLTPTAEMLAELRASGYPEINYDDPLHMQVDDKWGPAGCIQLEPEKFLFFGWASS